MYDKYTSDEEIKGSYRLLHTFCAQGGPGPPHFFQLQGGLVRSNFNPINHNFSDDFPVILWYIHMMLLH